MGFREFLSRFRKGSKRDLANSISEFCEDVRKSRNTEEAIRNLRNSKWHLIKGDKKQKGVVDIASKIDEGYPGFVSKDKKRDIDRLIHFIELIIKINEGLEHLFKRELKFGEKEIRKLRRISREMAEDEQELVAYHNNNARRIGLSEADIKLLKKVGELVGEEEQERREILTVISVIKSFDETVEMFKNAISRQTKECNEILAALERIKEALKGKSKEERKKDIGKIKTGVKSIVLEFRNELEFYKRFEKEEHFRDFVVGELVKEEERREIVAGEVKVLERERKLRVLIIPCSWGFGPVSKAVSLINAIIDIDDVIDQAGIVAAPEFCDFAKRAYSKIMTYELNENEIYDRVGPSTLSASIGKFIERLEKIFEEFKPNLVIDSLGYLGAIIAKIHGIKVVKIDHLFPELSKNKDAQRLGIQFFERYKKLSSQGKINEFKDLLIKYANIRAFQWLGDVFADYLIVSAFYQIEITPSILQYRGNKNIFFVNPCMNKKARLLMDDVFGVRAQMGRVLARFGRSMGLKGNFTRLILINTGGLSTELKPYKKGWEAYLRAITGVTKAVCSVNAEYEAAKSDERIGIVLVGALCESNEFGGYMKVNWDKQMRGIAAIPGNLRQDNVIRLFLTADVIITNLGQTSISEILTLNKPFLILPPVQSEQKRNVDFVVKSGIGLELQGLFDEEWNAKPDFRNTILNLINPNSRLNQDIRGKQQIVFRGLKEINRTLALIVSQVLGFKVHTKAGLAYVGPEAETYREPYTQPIPWTKKFSVVIPIMDKDPIFLENCLRSFRRAESDPDNIEIIVVDFESKPSLVSEYQKICRKYNAILHSILRRGRLFNPSLLKNYGARKAIGDYVVFCDVDCVSTSNVFEELKKAFTKNPKAYVVGRVYLDKEKRSQRFFDELTDDRLREIVVKEGLEFRPRSFGGFVAVDKEWIYESRGFDEGYIYWGAEDDDFRFRSVFIKKKKLVFLDHIGYVSWAETAKFSSVDMLYLTDVVLLHQWHEKRSQTKEDRLKKIIQSNTQRFNELRYHKRVIFKNSKNWGTNKIKILFVLPALYQGGVENVLISQCRALLEQGNFDIRVLATNATGPTYHKLTKLGINVVIPMSDKEHPNYLAYREILFFKPEILYITNSHIAKTVEVLKSIFREMRVLYHMRGEKQWCIDQVRSYANQLDLFIVTYDSMYRLVKDYVAGNKTFVLGNPIPKKFFEKSPTDNSVICYSGRLDRGKCLGSFVKIIANVKSQIPDVEGMIVGDEEGMKHNIGVRKRVDELSRERNVPIRITGFVDNVEDYLSKSKVFLLTSSSEGFCNSVWEAMAVGLIPVTTRVGSLIIALYKKKDTYLTDVEHQGEKDQDFLPPEVEKDLVTKCIQALRSKPDINAIKQLAMPFHEEIWSRKFVALMLKLVGVKYDERVLEETIPTEPKPPKPKSTSSKKDPIEEIIAKYGNYWIMNDFWMFCDFGNIDFKVNQQGPKIHIAFTERDAAEILSIVLPILQKYRFTHKVVMDIGKLRTQNTNRGDNTQIGKDIAVYIDGTSEMQRAENAGALLKVVDEALKNKGFALPEGLKWDKKGQMGDKLFMAGQGSGLVAYRWGSYNDDYLYALEKRAWVEDERGRYKAEGVFIQTVQIFNTHDEAERFLERRVKAKPV